MMDRPRVAVVASAQTPFARARPELHYGEMIRDTVVALLENAGCGIGDVETIVSAGDDVLDGRSISNVFVAEEMGAFLKEETKVEEDGAWAVIYALLRIWAGKFRTALVLGYSKGSECGPEPYTALQFDPFWQRPLGMTGLTAAALAATRYLTVTGATEEDAARVAVKNRANGVRNPNAAERTPVTLEEVLASEVLASPIRRLTTAPVTDGVAAVLLATEDVAGRYTDRPAWITGIGWETDLYYLGYRDLAFPVSLAGAARRAYAMAGIADPRSAFQVAEVHETHAFQEMPIAEGLGLCPQGEGWRLVRDGVSAADGALPINPSGGATCADPILATGIVRVAEASAQVTGRAGPCQVDGARRAVVHATCGPCLQSNAVLVVEG